MNITESQLRAAMINYMKDNMPTLTSLLVSWNEKLQQGVTLAPNLLYDLMGKNIESCLDPYLIYDVDLQNRYAELTIIPWVDRGNPFYVNFAYQVKSSDIPSEKVLFTIGEEHHLLGLWKEQIEPEEGEE